MRYIINFQVKVISDDKYVNIIRSSYTILEGEVEENSLFDFIKVESWFKKLFKEKTLDNFIDTSKIDYASSNLEMKLGRITNSISGEYKTFKEKL